MPEPVQRRGAPVFRSPIALVVLSVLVGIPLAGLVSAVVPDDLGLGFVGAWLIAAACSAAIVIVVMLLMYPPVAVDAGRGMIRIGSREVPATSITAVRRSISANGTAQYLHYRLRSDAGANARVLVLGRPFKGLGLEQAQALRDLIERSGLPALAAGGSAEAELLTGDTHTNLGAAAIGRDALLLELDHVIHGLGGPAPVVRTGAPTAGAARADAQAADAAGPDAARLDAAGPDATRLDAVAGPDAAAPASPDEQRLLGLMADLGADDDDAERAIAAAPRTAAVVARSAALAVAIAVAGFAGVCIWGVVQQSETGSTGIGDGPLAVLWWSIAVGLAALLVWAAAADRRVRRRRELGAAWLAADPVRAERGLAAPFLATALDPANRLLMIGAYGGAVFGALGLLLGIGMLATAGDDDLVGLAVGMLVVGVIALGLGVWGFVAAHRRRKALAAAFAGLAGRRGELAYARI